MLHTRTKFNRLYVAMLSVGFAQSATFVSAQSYVLEEILVTAQIRVESLQDVPVSVSAITGNKLMEAGISKIEDLQAYVPNLSMSETGIGTNIYIRGIGSGINQGFEQSVGMYVDGVSYGRAQLSRAPFLDLERVEVLRGPQNILFGKNSIAGALSIITAKPTDDFEGSVSVLFEPDQNEQVYDVIFSGPLTDSLSGRLAYRSRTADGYIENLTLNQDEPDRDEDTLRLIAQWEASDDLDFTFKYENSTFDVVGRQIEIIKESPVNNPLSPFNGLTYSQILVGAFAQDPSVLNNTGGDFKRSANGDSSQNETDNVTLTANYALGEHTLTFITGLLEYEFDELCDCDFTGANLFSVRSQEEYEQLSQEVRFTSAVGDTWEYIGGAFYQTSELQFRDNINIGPVLVAALNGNPLTPGFGTAIAGTTTPRTFTTDSDIYSAFLQATWNYTESLRLTAGGRYTHEEKDGARRLDITNADGSALAPGLADIVYLNVFNFNRHNLVGSRSEDQFSPLINVQYDLNADVMLYTTLSQGSKAGGYDARSNASTTPATKANGSIVVGSFEFDEEEATSFEVGAKSTLLDGAAEFNIAAFFTQYSDLQVSVFDGTLGFNVGNAGEAETMGIEMDGRYRVTESLTLIGSLALLDFEFTDFDNGQCNFGETPTSADGINCNYNGRTNQYVADFSGTFTADYAVSIGSALEFRATMDLVFTDDYNPSQTLDPVLVQDGYTKLNARVSFADSNDTWELALIGKNLTDEEIITYANSTPLSGSSFGAASSYAFYENGSTLAVQGLLRF